MTTMIAIRERQDRQNTLLPEHLLTISTGSKQTGKFE